MSSNDVHDKAAVVLVHDVIKISELDRVLFTRRSYKTKLEQAKEKFEMILINPFQYSGVCQDTLKHQNNRLYFARIKACQTC